MGRDGVEVLSRDHSRCPEKSDGDRDRVPCGKNAAILRASGTLSVGASRIGVANHRRGRRGHRAIGRRLALRRIKSAIEGPRSEIPTALRGGIYRRVLRYTIEGARALIGKETEDLILEDGSADSPAKLVLMKRRHFGRKEIL